jgi:hypothetical protein
MKLIISIILAAVCTLSVAQDRGIPKPKPVPPAPVRGEPVPKPVPPTPAKPSKPAQSKPVKQEDMARVEPGQPYVTVRAAYHDWKAKIKVRFDTDQFTLSRPSVPSH